MKVEQHRAMRRPFTARVEVVEVESERQVTSVTGDLSVFGCFVETPAPFPHGAKIRIRINHRGTTFVALGFVSMCDLREWAFDSVPLNRRTSRSSKIGWHSS